MEFDPQDQDIINLLTKLKGTTDAYPEHMFVPRRQAFQKQMMEVGLGIGAAAGGTKASRISRLTSNVVETVLIATILVEASAMAYLYREQLAGFLQTITANSKTEQVPLPSTIPTSLEIQGVSPSPAATFTTLPSATPVSGPVILMITPSGTAIPGSTLDAADPISATPDPKSNNGNHYGQTPKPERTKENNGNNNKPPKEKEDQPPKEKTKPPKDKK